MRALTCIHPVFFSTQNIALTQTYLWSQVIVNIVHCKEMKNKLKKIYLTATTRNTSKSLYTWKLYTSFPQ